MPRARVTRESLRSKLVPWRYGLLEPGILDLAADFWACFRALAFLFQPRFAMVKGASDLWRIGGRGIEGEEKEEERAGRDGERNKKDGRRIGPRDDGCPRRR